MEKKPQQKEGAPEAPKPASHIPAPEASEPSVIGYGWPKIDDPDAPVGYVAGPTPYILYHEANEILPDGTVRRKKS